MSFWRAARTSAALCAFFFIVYGSCNYFTSLRSDVGTWVYPWEHYIPFVPIFIIPYMSIDLFFVAGPFLCSDRRELSILSRRIVMAIVIAGFFFLIMPLKFTFERPHADGWLGVIFDNFRKMDRPFNQFPSLHIALRTILADLFARHTRWITRWSSHIWFSLIGLSTLLVYQHHIIDVVGGFLLAWLCFYVISEAPWRQPVTRNLKIGMRYLAGAVLLAALAALVWPWGAILLWPALSLTIVAAAYFGVGPGIFRKYNGRIPLASRLLLAPIIIGQRFSHHSYTGRSNAWDAITDHLWIGRTLSRDEAKAALSAGVTAILDLTGELPEASPFASHPNYLNLPVLDLTAPTPGQIRTAIDFIDAHAEKIVYVHCKAGYSRSAAVASAYLVHAGIVATQAEAIDLLRQRRPGIVIRPEVVSQV